MDLDLAERDATPDGVGMSTPTIPATRVVVLTRVYHQLIACVVSPCHLTMSHELPRAGHAALSTSGAGRVGHDLSIGLSCTCPRLTVCALE